MQINIYIYHIYIYRVQCPAWDHLRRPLVEEVSQCDGFQGQSLTKQAAFVLATACTNCTLLNYLCSMWYARFSVWLLVTCRTCDSATLDFLYVLAPYGLVQFNNDWLIDWLIDIYIYIYIYIIIYIVYIVYIVYIYRQQGVHDQWQVSVRSEVRWRKHQAVEPRWYHDLTILQSSWQMTSHCQQDIHNHIHYFHNQIPLSED